MFRYIILHIFIALIYISISPKPAGSVTGCRNEQDIIFDHYARVLEEIHGDAYYPHLMPPPRKPERITQ